MKKYAMIDVETLGTAPGCAILSVGAIPFDHTGVDEDPKRAFYRHIDIESCAAVGLRFEPKALLWWMEQPQAARDAAFHGRYLISGALQHLTEWLERGDYIALWSNGPGEDLAWLAAAYRACNMAVPFTHKQQRCYRTLRHLYPAILPNEHGTAHNALHDAIAQAYHAARILQAIDKQTAAP